MKDKKDISKGKKLGLAEILTGIIILVTVSVMAVHSDLSSAETRLYDTVTYIKEQCNNNLKLDIASESKSLLRMIESVELVNQQINEMPEKEAADKEAVLEKYATISYLTGILLLDENGQVQTEYCSDDIQSDELLSYIDQDSLLDVVDFKEKTYSMRIERKDDSYIDLAAMGRQDQPGILMVYYHTPERYTRIFNYSINSLLTGYSLEHNGTIVITKENQIVVSNNKKLIGKETEQIEELRYINASGEEKQLVTAGPGIIHSYGLMETGRDYYVYAYMPGSKVFAAAMRNILYTLLIYMVILGAGYIIRWNMVQGYQKRQIEMQRKYTEEYQNSFEWNYWIAAD